MPVVVRRSLARRLLREFRANAGFGDAIETKVKKLLKIYLAEINGEDELI